MRTAKNIPIAWQFIQWIGVLMSFVLIGCLLLWPEISLGLFWNVLIPILPATFLISPLIWRSICPLATLNMMGNGKVARYRMPASKLYLFNFIGIFLFLILVPMRLVVFNYDGTALGLCITGILAIAFISGRIFDAKAGFCNSICPVLPVEKLYGQFPLVSHPNVRCTSCTLCTAKGCIDVAPPKNVKKRLGILSSGKAPTSWLQTPMGIFSLLLPGFITGYFFMAASHAPTFLQVYLSISTWSIGSYACLFIVLRTLSLPSSIALPILGALSIGLYYWFAAAHITGYWTGPAALTISIRILSISLITIWLINRFDFWNVIKSTV